MVAGRLHRGAGARAILLLLVSWPLASQAMQCDPLLADRPSIVDATFAARGGERVKQSVRITAGRDVLVIAREQGLDVTLEVRDSAGKRVAAADNPVRRTGLQRAVFTTKADGEYSFEVLGKERPDIRGRIQLRAVILERASPDAACIDLHRTLSAADSAYALGQSVTRGTITDPKVSAEKAYAAAADDYKKVVAQLEKQAPTLLGAQAEHAAAAVMYQNVVDREQANMFAQRAERTYRAVSNSYGSARAQGLQAAALIELAVSPSVSAGVDASQRANEMLTRARSILETIAAFHATRGEVFDQAHALNDIGIAYFQQVQQDQAITAFKRALPLYEAIGDSLHRTEVLQNIAVAEYELGRASSALERYKAVLQLTSSKEPLTYLVVLNNAALASWFTGDLDAALAQYGEALDLARARQVVSEEARSLNGIGSVYNSIGDHDLALDFYRQALALRPPGSDGRARIASLRAIANILNEQGNAAEALKLHREALQLASNPAIVASTRVQLAEDFEQLGQKSDALKELDTVLLERAAGVEMSRATALVARSRLQMSPANAPATEADLRNALKTFREFESPGKQFAAWIELARLKRMQGASSEALAAIDNALVLAEEVRLQSANPELRATAMQPLRPAFDVKIAMLADRYFGSGESGGKGRDDSAAMTALLTAEQARARALADFQRFDASDAQVAPEHAERRRTLYKELATRRGQLEARLDRSGSNDPRVPILRRDIAELRQQLDTLNADIASSSRAGGETKAGARKAIDQSAIPTDTAIIEYWLGASDAFAWVLTREKLSMVRLGNTAAVTSAARALHESLSNFGTVPVAERLKLGENLHARILEPVVPLLAGKRTLVVAPDGALHYVPFAALRGTGPDGRKAFLIESHDLAVTASIGMLLSADARPQVADSRKQMLLVDDPVYEADDVRLAAVANGPKTSKRAVSWPVALLRGGDTRELSRLPATGREAAAISALLPKAQVDQLEGFAATKERFLGANLSGYRFIHVASHAVADAEIPQLSALILSTRDQRGQPLDGRVLAADFLNTQLNADAVVLSACDTALGKDVAGEGLMGLRYVVLARGAKSVVSSLWQVPDVMAAQTMTRFYAALLRRNLSVIPASGAAMREMISTPFKDPALWAAFAVTVAQLPKQ